MSRGRPQFSLLALASVPACGSLHNTALHLCTVFHHLGLLAAMADSAAPAALPSAEQLRRRAKNDRQKLQRAEQHSALAARAAADRLAGAPSAGPGAGASGGLAVADGGIPGGGSLQPAVPGSGSSATSSAAAPLGGAPADHPSPAAAADAGTRAINVPAVAKAPVEASSAAAADVGARRLPCHRM